MLPINLKRHKKKFDLQKRSLRYFITRFENNPPKDIQKMVMKANQEVWNEIDCLSCANCCKVMSPTYDEADIKRITTYLGMNADEFKKKWLYLDKRGKEWMNISRPCQFLDLATNKCSIYEVRPKDCAQFPHTIRRPILDYFHIHKQNIEYCPATMAFIEKLQESIKNPI